MIPPDKFHNEVYNSNKNSKQKSLKIIAILNVTSFTSIKELITNNKYLQALYELLPNLLFIVYIKKELIQIVFHMLIPLKKIFIIIIYLVITSQLSVCRFSFIWIIIIKLSL